MSDQPRTDAGKRLVAWAQARDLYISPKFVATEALAIEAEAVVAERQRIAAGVEGLPGWEVVSGIQRARVVESADAVDRAAVLRIVAGDAP